MAELGLLEALLGVGLVPMTTGVLILMCHMIHLKHHLTDHRKYDVNC